MSSSEPIRPSHIKWRGPQGIEICLNEEMVYLTATRSASLEEVEINQLIDVIVAARKAQNEGTVLIPQPPEVPF